MSERGLPTDAPGGALPSALDPDRGVVAALAGLRPAVFLDFDGTLAPIAARPDLAVLDPAVRASVARLGELCTVAIVSGRSREDVHARMGVDAIYYAGNHGFEIEGPRHTDIKHDIGAEYLAEIDDAHRRIARGVAGIDGVVLEHKRISLSVHYRLVAPSQAAAVQTAVEQALRHDPRLRLHHGKMVLEIRPAIDWDKGKAVLWLLDALHVDAPDILPIYVGDDVTDEDAFRALRGRGLGVLVADAPRATQATHLLRDCAEVKQLLDALIAALTRET